MAEKAKVERTEKGLVPADDGWFILNLAEIRWETLDGGGTWCSFESLDMPSSLLGIGVHILRPGDKPGYYHAESNQEGFLVLSGECLVLIQGEERRLGAWDFFHCAPHTKHAFVGLGDAPCVLLIAGARPPDGSILYARDETALKHSAGVEEETPSPHEAYAPFPHWRLGRPDGWEELPWARRA